MNVLCKEHKIKRGRGTCFKNFNQHISSQNGHILPAKEGKSHYYCASCIIVMTNLMVI